MDVLKRLVCREVEVILMRLPEGSRPASHRHGRRTGATRQQLSQGLLIRVGAYSAMGREARLSQAASRHPSPYLAHDDYQNFNFLFRLR